MKKKLFLVVLSTLIVVSFGLTTFAEDIIIGSRSDAIDELFDGDTIKNSAEVPFELIVPDTGYSILIPEAMEYSVSLDGGNILADCKSEEDESPTNLIGVSGVIAGSKSLKISVALSGTDAEYFALRKDGDFIIDETDSNNRSGYAILDRYLARDINHINLDLVGTSDGYRYCGPAGKLSLMATFKIEEITNSVNGLLEWRKSEGV